MDIIIKFFVAASEISVTKRSGPPPWTHVGVVSAKPGYRGLLGHCVAIEPSLIRYPGLDAADFRAKLDHALSDSGGQE